MCSDKDCTIFRGAILACDVCERWWKTYGQMPKVSELPTNSPSVR